jgi:hypothetical protein
MGNRVAHMSAPHKEYIGWLPANQIQEVNNSASYTILPMTNSGTGLKAIKIPRGNGDYLYVEYRQPIGFDSQLGNVANSDIFQGALLHTLASPNQTLLIDASPPMEIPFTFSPVLKPNSIFTDPVTGVSIMVTDVNSNSMTVQVAYPGTTLQPTTAAPTPTPTNTPTVTPTGTIYPSPTSIISPTNSIQPTQIPSATRIPTSTPITFQISVKLKGIGNVSGVNTNPKDTNINVSGEVYDQQNNRVYTFVTEALYTTQTGTYKGTANTNLSSGKYFLKLRTDNSLWKKDSIIDYGIGSNDVPTISVLIGDFNGDNQISMSDHSLLVSCYGSKRCSNKTKYDLNFDGVVNGVDYNIFISNLLERRSGD